MHKITATLATAIALLGLSTQAAAVPIQITGSELEVDGFGVGDYTYTDFAGLLNLAEGESQVFNFGHVDILDGDCGWLGDCATALGVVALTVQLSSPVLDSAFGALALFGITSHDNEGNVRVEWSGPAFAGYSWGGQSGGILALDMFDLGSGLFDWEEFEGGIDLYGRITNVRSPSPTVYVSEPGILLLFGGALLAVAGLRRRSATRA